MSVFTFVCISLLMRKIFGNYIFFVTPAIMDLNSTIDSMNSKYCNN